MIHILIDHKVWNIVRQAAARNDPRSAFNGVHVVSDGHTLRLEATDDHIVAVYESKQEGLEPLDEVIQPGRLPAKGASRLTYGSDGAACFLHQGGAVHLDFVPGTFPDTGRALYAPDQCSGEPASFDPALLARAFKAFADLNLNKSPVRVRLHYNGQRPALAASIDLPQLRVAIAPMKERKS